MNYIPPPYPSPFIWRDIFNQKNNRTHDEYQNKWLTPTYNFVNYPQQQQQLQQSFPHSPTSPTHMTPSSFVARNDAVTYQDQRQSYHSPMSKEKGKVVFDSSWLKAFRENKEKYGDPETLQMQKQAEEYAKYKKMKSKARMQLKKKNKKNHNGRNRKKWYNNYIPNDQKYVEDSTFGNVDKSMSTIDHEIALIESELNEHYTRQLNTYKDTEVWPATPLRFLS